MKRIVRWKWCYVCRRARLAVIRSGDFCRRYLWWLVALCGGAGAVLVLLYRFFFGGDDGSSLKEISLNDYKDLLYKEDEIESICAARKQDEVERLERIGADKLAGQFDSVCDAVAGGKIRLEQRFYAAAGLEPNRAE